MSLRNALLILACIIPGVSSPYHAVISPGAPAPYLQVTHLAITREAISKAANHRTFLDALGIEDKEYSDSPFFVEARATAPVDERRAIHFGRRYAGALIEAGAVAEDDDRNSTWRWLRHFMDPQNGDGGWRLNAAHGRARNARDWGFDGAGDPVPNEFTWTRALQDMRMACGLTGGGTATARDEAEEHLFYALGHVLHLVEDLCQPAHTRNDGHGHVALGHSELEYVYGRENLLPGSLPPTVKAAVNAALPEYHVTYGGYFTSAAVFSNEQFFSDGTIFDNYLRPQRGVDTAERTDEVGPDGAEVLFVVSTNLDDDATGIEERLARSALLHNTLNSPDNLVVLDNAEKLIPKAVALAAGLINHLFRGQLSVEADENDLIITNTSDVAHLNGDMANASFSEGSLTLLYEEQDGTRLPFGSVPVASLAPGEHLPVAGVLLGIPETAVGPDGATVIVVYDGVIGREVGIAARRITGVRPDYPSNEQPWNVGSICFGIDGLPVPEGVESSLSWPFGNGSTTITEVTALSVDSRAFTSVFSFGCAPCNIALRMSVVHDQSGTEMVLWDGLTNSLEFLVSFADDATRPPNSPLPGNGGFASMRPVHPLSGLVGLPVGGTLTTKYLWTRNDCGGSCSITVRSHTTCCGILENTSLFCYGAAGFAE